MIDQQHHWGQHLTNELDSVHRFNKNKRLAWEYARAGLISISEFMVAKYGRENTFTAVDDLAITILQGTPLPDFQATFLTPPTEQRIPRAWWKGFASGFLLAVAILLPVVRWLTS